MIKKLEPFDVTWVEQPIAQMDLSMFQRLQESSPTPLMADESLINAQHLRTLVEHQSVDYINIKLMKSGGIYPAYQLATQAELFGINCQIGSMVESSIASAAGFHVALAKKNIVSTEISGPTKFTKDVGDLTYSLPYANITNKPGLGINVDDAVIKELTTRSEEMML
jgi:L-alanine-DL-glutamate epimerase-like enolase superfamily enzyme